MLLMEITKPSPMKELEMRLQSFRDWLTQGSHTPEEIRTELENNIGDIARVEMERSPRVEKGDMNANASYDQDADEEGDIPFEIELIFPLRDKNSSDDVNVLKNYYNINENIEDDSRNSTRFLVLSKQDIGISGNDKTSIVVATKNKPGAIADLVEPFAKNKVSMTKLESRPAKIGMWEYVFFIDLEGHLRDKKVKTSLEQIESRASFIKVLGSYPASNDK